MLRHLVITVFCLMTNALQAAPVSIPGLSFDDSPALKAGLPKSNGGLTRDTLLGVHGSAQPNSGITLDRLIGQFAGSAEPNSGFTARDFGLFGAANGYTVYAGLVPVAIPVAGAPRGTPPQDWLFGILCTTDGPTFALAKSNLTGLSEITGFGLDDTNADLLAALIPLGFGSDDIRNVQFAQTATISGVPLPLSTPFLAVGLMGLGMIRSFGWQRVVNARHVKEGKYHG